MKDDFNSFGISAFALKLIALAAMTADHAGLILFDGVAAFRIIGRLSFPIFAYMIAEGCRYTKNKAKYLLKIAALGALCQIVFYTAQRSLYMGILISFSISAAMIFSIDYARKKANTVAWFFPLLLTIAAVLLCYSLPAVLPGFKIDYGFFGILLPVLVYLGRNKIEKLSLAFICLVLICLSFGGVQWYSLFAIIPLAFYNGARGRYPLKYFFYIYYPLHMVLLYALSYIIK